MKKLIKWFGVFAVIGTAIGLVTAYFCKNNSENAILTLLKMKILILMLICSRLPEENMYLLRRLLKNLR